MDFLDFPLPLEPSVYFLFDPCDEYVLGKLLSRIDGSLRSHPKQMHLLYVAPTMAKEQMLDSSRFLTKVVRDCENNFCVYTAL
jgi:hypothetical protein